MDPSAATPDVVGAFPGGSVGAGGDEGLRAWLEIESQDDRNAVCFGHGLAPAAETELRAAATAWNDEPRAQAHVEQALALAPDHPATHIGLYRFYFYRNRLADALAAGRTCLALAARMNNLPADWRNVRRDQAEFASYAALPRFYLFTLKGCAYLSLRLGSIDDGRALLAKLAELDPADRLGGGVLDGVLARVGTEDDE